LKKDIQSLPPRSPESENLKGAFKAHLVKSEMRDMHKFKGIRAPQIPGLLPPILCKICISPIYPPSQVLGSTPGKLIFNLGSKHYFCP
jgi:hypothetical protein